MGQQERGKEKILMVRGGDAEKNDKGLLLSAEGRIPSLI